MALVVAGSAVGVVGWYVQTNRRGPAIDASGFDLSAAPGSTRPAPVLSARDATPARPVSSLGYLKADAGVRIADSNAGVLAAPRRDAASPAKSFTDAARESEPLVRRFAERMTRRYPVIRQYGRDWMSRPDLRKLNDDYMRNHDPIAFLRGLAKAPSAGPMVKKYAGSPEIREFVVGGIKEAPSALFSSAMDALQSDGAIKDVVAHVADGIGLPPSVTALISAGDPSKVDQNKVLGDMLASPPVRQALQPR